MASPKINAHRPEYDDKVPQWELIRDCLKGQRTIKAGREKYLPKPNPTDTSVENDRRYDDYLARAVFYNVCTRTVEGMVGHVFKTDPVVKIPDAMEYLLADIDGGGISLEQQAKRTLRDVLAFGRCGLLVDFPKTEGPTTKADQITGRIRPTVIFYDAFQIINWRTVTIGAKLMLSLLVLAEMSVVADDGFEAKTEPTWRVLRLAQQGVTVERWRKRKDGDESKDEFVQIEPPIFITDGSGNNWDEIPFSFVGVVNNDSFPDNPPIYDMAEINLAHFRNSADLEESAFVCGQPTLVMAGLTQDWVDHNLKGVVKFGSRGGIPLPVGGAAELLQADPNNLIKEIMVDKERQMIAIGAKLIEQQQVERTAFDAALSSSSETSVLGSCAKNVSDAFTACLKWCNRFAKIEDDNTSYQLDSTFAEGTLDAQELAQVMGLWQGGAISWTEFRKLLKENGTAFQDDEEAKSEIESEAPSYGLVSREQLLKEEQQNGQDANA